MSKESLKISVVTVVYNRAEEIEKTILSIVDQSYDNIEYIVVDGASTDGTVNIIKKYVEGGSETNKHRHRIFRWISEPDKGIYDAMNKGISLATGDYINFLNSGDYYYADNVIDLIVRNIKNSEDIIYGDVMFETDEFRYWRHCFPLDKMKEIMVPPHPSSFIKRAYHQIHPYDTSYKSSADFNFFYKAFFLDHCSFLYIPYILTVFDDRYGMSKDNFCLVLMENSRITGMSSKMLNLKVCYLKILSYIKKIIKRSIPKSSLKRIYKKNLLKQGYYILDIK